MTHGVWANSPYERTGFGIRDDNSLTKLYGLGSGMSIVLIWIHRVLGNGLSGSLWFMGFGAMDN